MAVAISVMLMSLGVPHVLFFIPSFAESLNIGVDGATLLSATSIFDLMGRVVFGFIIDADLFPKHYAFAAMILLAGKPSLKRVSNNQSSIGIDVLPHRYLRSIVAFIKQCSHIIFLDGWLWLWCWGLVSYGAPSTRRLLWN